jgi:hypothetical protein
MTISSLPSQVHFGTAPLPLPGERDLMVEVAAAKVKLHDFALPLFPAKPGLLVGRAWQSCTLTAFAIHSGAVPNRRG